MVKFFIRRPLAKNEQRRNYTVIPSVARECSVTIEWSFSTKSRNIKTLSDLRTKFQSIVKQNEEISGKAAAAQNTSKILQEAFQKTNEKLVDLERQQHKLEQYSRTDCLGITGIPNTVGNYDLESFALYVVNEIGVKIDKKRILLHATDWEEPTQQSWNS